MVDKTKNVSSMRKRAHNGIDNMMDKAESIGESGKEKIIHLKERAIKARENFDGYIKRNPEKSVLIAAGVGITVGAIVTAIIMRKRR